MIKESIYDYLQSFIFDMHHLPFFSVEELCISALCKPSYANPCIFIHTMSSFRCIVGIMSEIACDRFSSMRV